MQFDSMGDGPRPAVLDEPETSPRMPGHGYRHVREFLGEHGPGRQLSTTATLFGFSPLPRRSRRLFRAACGELAVADALRQLGSEWSVCDSVSVSIDGGAVDHLAVGPPGAFAIAVRSHVGGELWVSDNVMLVDGERVAHVRDSEAAAVRTSQLLSDAVEERIEVTPCLVVLDPRSLTVARPPRRVAIVTTRELKSWLRNLPRVLSDDQVTRLCVAASAKSTWRDRPDASEQPELAVGVFRALQAKVYRSRRIRLCWVTGLLVAMWIGVMASAIGVAAQLPFS